MNIQRITNFTTFKSSYQDSGYDDPFFQSVRNAIRKHYAKWHMPHQDIFEKEHKLTDYEILHIINNLEKYHEMQKIEGTNIYRGQTLVDKTDCLQALSAKGIKTVIDLVDYGDSYKQAIKKAGMDYFAYNIYSNWWDLSYLETPKMPKLIEFLKKMQEDNIYIGCQHGSNDTDVAFILNEFFNPKLEGKAKTKIPPNDSDFPLKLNLIYDALKPEDKKLLGWTKEFEQRLVKKLISI